MGLQCGAIDQALKGSWDLVTIVRVTILIITHNPT